MPCRGVRGASKYYIYRLLSVLQLEVLEIGIFEQKRGRQLADKGCCKSKKVQKYCQWKLVDRGDSDKHNKLGCFETCIVSKPMF